MDYYNKEELIIRSMLERDSQILAEAFLAQGWDKPVSLFEKYYRRQESDEHLVCIAEVKNQLAGYVTLLPETSAGPFSSLKILEIVDLNVLMDYQMDGVGSALLYCAEMLAGQFSDTVSLAVGLHYGYGAAQRLYVKKGYIPDGSGVWYQGSQLEQYADCVNDDELVLYLSKQFGQQENHHYNRL